MVRGGRILGPELMDDAGCGPEEFERCLRDLQRVNRMFGAARPTLAFLRRARRAMPADRAWRILDVGGGSGDMGRRIVAWAARRGIAAIVTSLDRSPWAKGAGERLTWEAGGAGHGAGPGQVRFVTADLFGYAPAEPPDLVVSSLFAHHLDDAELVRFLRWMEQHAAVGWFVNDLRRSELASHGFEVVAALMRWHRFVRHDGPVSIRRAFVARDWRALLVAAGIDGARVRRWAPFRLCVDRLRERG